MYLSFFGKARGGRCDSLVALVADVDERKRVAQQLALDKVLRLGKFGERRCVVHLEHVRVAVHVEQHVKAEQVKALAQAREAAVSESSKENKQTKKSVTLLR